MESPPSPAIPKIRATLFAQRRIIFRGVQYAEVAFLVVVIALAGKGAAFDAPAFGHLFHMVDRVLGVVGDDLRRVDAVVAAAGRDILALGFGLLLRLVGHFLGLRVVALGLVDAAFFGHDVPLSVA